MRNEPETSARVTSPRISHYVLPQQWMRRDLAALATSLFGRLQSARRRALAERQLRILDLLLEDGSIEAEDLVRRMYVHYRNLKFPERAMGRDIAELLHLSAIEVAEGRFSVKFSVNLDWPQQSEPELVERYEQMPSAASADHPAMAELSRLLMRRR